MRLRGVLKYSTITSGGRYAMTSGHSVKPTLSVSLLVCLELEKLCLKEKGERN